MSASYYTGINFSGNNRGFRLCICMRPMLGKVVLSIFNAEPSNEKPLYEETINREQFNTIFADQTCTENFYKKMVSVIEKHGHEAYKDDEYTFYFEQVNSRSGKEKFLAFIKNRNIVKKFNRMVEYENAPFEKKLQYI